MVCCSKSVTLIIPGRFHNDNIIIIIVADLPKLAIYIHFLIRYGQYHNGVSVEESLTMPLRQRAEERYITWKFGLRSIAAR